MCVSQDGIPNLVIPQDKSCWHVKAEHPSRELRLLPAPRIRGKSPGARRSALVALASLELVRLQGGVAALARGNAEKYELVSTHPPLRLRFWPARSELVDIPSDLDSDIAVLAPSASLRVHAI